MPSRPASSDAANRPNLAFLAAGGLIVVVLGVGFLSSGGGSSPEALGPDTAMTTTILVDSAAPVTTVAETVATVPTVPPLAATLVKGSNGDDVVRLQQRLSDLGFQPGPVDGQFGTGTQQAVWAFKKLAGNLEWDDFAALGDETSVSEDVWQQMNDPAFAVVPRRPNTGKHIEIYLPLQVLALFDADNQPMFVTHISSGILNPDGTPATFCEDATYTTNIQGEPLDEPETKAICAEAKTPGGVFRLKRYEDGQHVSPLGGMKNPWYFNYGIAIHGAQNVPDYPASHGCVRMSNSLADTFPSLVEKGNAVYVWGLDGKEPEGYTQKESLPSFNRPDPDATTTTTSTTTIPTTTIPSTTTVVTSTSVKPTTTPPTTAPATTTPPTTVAPTTVAPTTAAPTTVPQP